MTTYFVALSVVVATIQIYLLWRLLAAFGVLRRFEERLGHYGDALSLLTETSETGFDSVTRELERLRMLGEVRTELRSAAAVRPAPSRTQTAEAVAEALMARVDATPAHLLAQSRLDDVRAPERGAQRPTDAHRPVENAVARPTAAPSGPTVSFVQVAGTPAAGSVSASTVGRRETVGPAIERDRDEPLEPASDAALAHTAASGDPVADVVRLLETAQGRPSAAQLSEAAVRLRMHLAGGAAVARHTQTARSPQSATRGRQEGAHGLLRA